jgi:hypothetical protein
MIGSVPIAWLGNLHYFATESRGVALAQGVRARFESLINSHIGGDFRVGLFTASRVHTETIILKVLKCDSFGSFQRHTIIRSTPEMEYKRHSKTTYSTDPS